MRLNFIACKYTVFIQNIFYQEATFFVNDKKIAFKWRNYKHVSYMSWD